MDRKDFIRLQFETLRGEIASSKDRAFKTLGFGLTIVPAAQVIAQMKDIPIATLSLPLLVVVVGLLYLSENNALMRAGRYIKKHIEPEINEVVGWEEWLEQSSSNNRSVDKYLAYAFHLLFAVYYIGSVYLAAVVAYKEYSVFTVATIASAYVLLGIIFFIFLSKSIRVSTK